MAFKHDVIEKNSILLLVLTLIVVSIGGLVEIAPLFYLESTIEKVKGMRPYSPLELAGRNIYIREGCYNCHSQMVRPLRDEEERYGHYSLAAESMYDHPFQWGSKRTGPDLAREGGKRPNVWHYDHMRRPTDISPGSNMPPYPWLLEKKVDFSRIPGKISAMRTLGVPYPEMSDEEILAQVQEQAQSIVNDLESNFRAAQPDTQIVALIAYLQKLGTSEDSQSALARVEAAK